MQGFNNTNSTGPYPQPPLGLLVLCGIGAIGVLLMAIVGGIYNAIKTAERNRNTTSDSPVSARISGSINDPQGNISADDDQSVLPLPYVPLAKSKQQQKSIKKAGTMVANDKKEKKGKSFTFVV
jgi:hypothetical protein